MNIFLGIAHNKHYETIHEAVIALVKRGKSRSLLERGTPWSLAELALDQEDYAWLCSWARALVPGVAQRCLERGQWERFETAIGTCSEVTGIGILLLLFSVEVARREASERVLWPIVSQSDFGEETRKILFAQNHPTRSFKDAIELAARWLKLRHVFGIEGLQSWYDTLYLQLGFTRAGFYNRLPEWLVGNYPTFAMQQLLNGPMQSESFRTLWQTLGMYRRNQMMEAQVRRKLQESAWILQEWIPALMQQARARPHLSAVSATREGVGSAEEISFEEDTFLSTPELSWDTFGEPIFTCACLPNTLFALTDPVYSLHIGGKTYSQLQRTEDGTYQAHPMRWTVPISTPLSIATLVAMDGSVVQSQTVQLWDQGEDVSAFSFSGELFDPWNKAMLTKRRYYLLLSADLEIQPRPVYWHHINAQTTLYMLEPDWSAETQVLLNGKLLWQPLLSSAPRPVALLKSGAVQVRLYEPPPPLVFQKPFRLTIEHPEEYELLYIRLAGQALDFEAHTRRLAVTRAIALEPQMFALKTLACLDINLGFQQKETQVIERVPYRLDLPVSGVTVLEQDGWRVLERDRLNLAQIQWKPLRFYLKDIASWSLFEGTTWIDTAWQRPKQLQACAGFGAPLKLQRSIYNNNALERPLWIVGQVINTGCVEKMVMLDEGVEVASRMEVQLLRPLEPGALHTVIWWDQGGAYSVLQPERHEVKEEKASWFVRLPAECTKPIAVGIAYDGEWLGAWFSDTWADVYDDEVSEEDVVRRAVLLRWFHLPLLDKDLFDYSAHFAHEHANEVLPLWLGQQAVPGLSFTDGNEGWLAVVRSIYFNWQPGDDVGGLIMNISDPLGGDSLLDVAQKLVGLLGRVNPILMARVIRAWIEHVCLPLGGVPSCTALIRSLYYGIAEVTNERALGEKKRQLLQELAVVMDVDSAFIEKSLIGEGLRFFQGQKMKVIPGRNIAIAMHVEPFRRVLSIYLLEYLNEQLREKRGGK